MAEIDTELGISLAAFWHNPPQRQADSLEDVLVE
jgi:hypothetical protein